MVFALVGLGLWRQTEFWEQQAAIPKAWVEAKEPTPVSSHDLGFDSAIVWQKAMGVILWFFAAFCAFSVIFQLMGML